MLNKVGKASISPLSCLIGKVGVLQQLGSWHEQRSHPLPRLVSILLGFSAFKRRLHCGFCTDNMRTHSMSSAWTQPCCKNPISQVGLEPKSDNSLIWVPTSTCETAWSREEPLALDMYPFTQSIFLFLCWPPSDENFP